MDTSLNRASLVVPIAPAPILRTFAALWRDEDTAAWQSVAVIAYNANDAREIVAELIGHYDIKVQAL